MNHHEKLFAPPHRVLPPHVANILEVTAIPVPRQCRARNSTQKRQQRPQQQKWTPASSAGLYVHQADSSRQRRGSHWSEGSQTSRGYLDLLLSSPDDLDDEASLAGGDCGSGCGADTFSLGSVSCGSVPSLERDDDDGLDSPESHTETPPSLDRKVYSPRSTIQVSESQACSDDHPLLFSAEDPLDDFVPEVQSTMSSAPPKRYPTLRSTFKSNLTASLRAIKLAAQSVSQFTAPSLRHDDFLIRSFSSFSMSSTDDRRPEPMHQPPSPALRRYLNPINLHAFSEFHRDHAFNIMDMKQVMPVQMKTYRRSTSQGGKPCPNFPSERLNQPNSFETTAESSQSDAAPPSPDMMPRQCRENGEFLRIIVLEMNMRRRGKLRLDSPGKARYMLPPKKTSLGFVPRLQYTSQSVSKKQTPERWVAFTHEY
ncbi:hypothetical protein KEM56_001277 [Ascosphaera pollenicola]|nr:hypothetical protein KEM56_001277 [Ascosphaera pollenicola]